MTPSARAPRPANAESDRFTAWVADYLDHAATQETHAGRVGLHRLNRKEYANAVRDLFGVEIRPWANAPVWHDSVEAFEMYDGGRLIGRFFLDMHPRDNKFKHQAHFRLVYGKDGSDSISGGEGKRAMDQVRRAVARMDDGAR